MWTNLNKSSFSSRQMSGWIMLCGCSLGRQGKKQIHTISSISTIVCFVLRNSFGESKEAWFTLVKGLLMSVS